MVVDGDLIYPALRLARITGGPGRMPSPDQVDDAFQSLNRMLDSWNLKEGMIYRVDNSQYTMSPPKAVYSIGRGAGADFVADRPVRIQAAEIVLSTGGSTVYLPMVILTAAQWADTRLRSFSTTFPTQMYPDYAYPNCNLYMWGTPTQVNNIELWTWQQAKQFLTSSDTIVVPPGYLEAMVNNLAVRMGEQFGTTQLMSPTVFATAKKSLADVKGLNQPSPVIGSADVGVATSKRGDFNFFTGGPN
jgi:hypothetical protein